MAYFSGELTSYTIQLDSGSGNIGAWVVCDAGSVGGVYLRFIRSGALPANTTNVTASGRRQFYLSYQYGELAQIVDILRNERPVMFFFRDDVMLGAVMTMAEPVRTTARPRGRSYPRVGRLSTAGGRRTCSRRQSAPC